VSNILFVLYHDFSANSAVHVHNFANELIALGHSAAVAVPILEDTGSALGKQHYAVLSYDDVDGDWARVFTNALPPDILHAWTPRENVRLFCEKIQPLCSALLFIHLEDNEELILEKNLGMSFEEIGRSPWLELPGNLSHPRNYRRFIQAADGITMIMDRLEKFVPASKAKLVLWPGADRASFYPREKDEESLARLGIAQGNIVLCYTGNVHSANAREVRSLYLAAAILSREGTPTTLVRAGSDYCSFLGPDEKWAREISVDLGYVKHVDIPAVLGLADFLVQPGADDAFNMYRLPAKLPEFFAMGRPVIIPRSNVGRFVRHGAEAWLLDKVDALGIAGAVSHLRADPALSERLAAGALQFCRQHFDWKKNASALAHFYDEVAAKPKQDPNVPATAVS
jgi:glycosyltransferase involved in cell wall biosynthesis